MTKWSPRRGGLLSVWLAILVLAMPGVHADEAVSPAVAVPAVPLVPATATHTPMGAWTADLPVVGDGTHLWTVAAGVKEVSGKPDQPIVRIYHAQTTDQPPLWEPVTELRGSIASVGLVAWRDRLSMVFDDGTAQSITLRPAPIKGNWYFSLQSSESMPPGMSVRGMAADGESVWALVRIETAEALAEFKRLAAGGDASPRDPLLGELDPELLNLVLRLPRGLDVITPTAPVPPGNPETPGNPGNPGTTTDESPAPADDAPGTGDLENPESPPPDADGSKASADEAATKPAADLAALQAELPAEGLLRWSPGGRLQRIALPEAWDKGRSAHLAATPAPGSAPAPGSSGTSGGGGGGGGVVVTTQLRDRLDVWRWSQGIWSRVQLELADNGAVVPLTVGRQVLLARQVAAEDAFVVRVDALRGQELVEVGRLRVGVSEGLPAGGEWTVLPWRDDEVALAVGERGLADNVAELLKAGAADAAPGPIITAMDLNGRSTLSPVTLGIDPRSPLQEQADTILLMGVVISSTILLFTFWKRDPLSNVLKLPTGWVLSDLSRRMFAGLIDVVPGIAVAMLAWDLSLQELHTRWPGRGLGATWNLMLPGVVAIGITVLHTLLLEAITGRSLGKAITGLRVVTLDGGKPALWRVAVRCLLKAFDLVAYLLLVLMVVSPYKQRLGDMVAGTVVVAKGAGTGGGGDDADTDKDRGKGTNPDKDGDDAP